MAAHSHEISSSVLVANFIANEVPSGFVDGFNTDFVLANTPIVGTVHVHLNGMVQVPGSGLDYTIAGLIITFSKAPRSNSEILVHYIKS